MSVISGLIYNIVPFVTVLSLLVFVHEMGHYLVARYNGVRIEVFSIGFGPEIIGWTDRHLTRWKISLIPFGGYVRMFSDLNAASQPDAKALAQISEEDKQYALHYKTVWQRIAVSAAGPAANYLFAILLFGTLYIFVGQDRVTDLARIGDIMPQGAAAQAGFQTGDEILTIDGHSISTFKELHDVIRAHPGEELSISGQRAGQPFALKVIPQSVEGGKAGQLGVTPFKEKVFHPFWRAYGDAAVDVYKFSVQTLQHIGGMILGKNSTEGLSGPLGIAALTGQVAQKSFVNLLVLMALLSVNLGLINLFPVPMLDGGHLLFYFIEALRGKPVPESVQEWGYRMGFGLVILLMVISTWNDLKHLKIIEFFLKFF